MSNQDKVKRDGVLTPPKTISVNMNTENVDAL